MTSTPRLPTQCSNLWHRIFTKSETSALFIFESHSGLDRKILPRIHRFYLRENCYSPMDDGRVIGHGLSKRCAMVIRAGAGDMIAITEKLSTDSQLIWRYFRVDQEMEISPFYSDRRKLSREEINRLLKKNHQNSEFLSVTKEEISELFSGNQPSWLQRILEVQLSHWYQEEPLNYYKHTRTLPVGSELQRCVNLAPYQALARWRKILTPAQLDQAIETSSEAAVRFAFDDIPDSLREDYLEQHPALALRNLDRLSDAELALCSAADSKTALPLRYGLSPRRKAIVLANSYRGFWTKRDDEFLPNFRSEVLGSICSFPSEWFSAHSECLRRLMGDLVLFLNLELDDATFAHLLGSAEPAVRTAIAKHIAARV